VRRHEADCSRGGEGKCLKLYSKRSNLKHTADGGDLCTTGGSKSVGGKNRDNQGDRSLSVTLKMGGKAIRD